MKQEETTSRQKGQPEEHKTTVREKLCLRIKKSFPANRKTETATMRRWIAAVVPLLLTSGAGLLLLWSEAGHRQKTACHIDCSKYIMQKNDISENENGGQTAVVGDATTPQIHFKNNKEHSFSIGGRNYTIKSEVVDGKSVMLFVKVEDKINVPRDLTENISTERVRHDDTHQVVRGSEFSVMPKTFVPTPRFRHHFTASLVASNITFANVKNNNGALTNPSMLNRYDNGGNNAAGGTLFVPRLSLAGHEEHTEHKAPLTIGLRLGYDITPRMWVESGVQYSKLSSTFVREMGGNRQSTEQALHYVGVPVGVGYRLFDFGRLSFYGVAGAQADFNVKHDGSIESVEKETVKDDVQFSANAALGVQIKLTSNLGIYIEPGTRYYFDNGSDVKNYYKENKLNFNLQVGARWNIGNK
ncbi:porin family protein [Prevotella sp. OH937_COT-195]|uniref:porin family protein n=1 Tax=Prevotella sp. OH937_COT-195 TaxID=2491051 RepID=UPI000F654A5C|nr:porin family protein [Prevotella sp. OH937_COT-195]RRD02380.1 porin family protein [Prevotella sp. OH937_COT-195]